MNNKIIENCDIRISKASNGFIVMIPPFEEIESVMGGNIGCLRKSPIKPYVFENLKNMQMFIKNHFKSK